ncbi:glycoside hydrolase family 31 protein [Asticcacaulis solisilvae]|uniref:glycoside hydrolase family 31 protein n=1 Tax=Asticcacaulis solisilvae TaxID=1217274 RepID=UPI003FD6E952
MRKAIILTCVSLLALAGQVLAGQVLAGQVLASQVMRDDHGIRIDTGAGIVSVEMMSDRIAHIRFGTKDYAGNYNPAVITTAKPVAFTVSEAADTVTLATAAFKVQVAKTDGAVGFLTLDDKPLLAEAGRDLGHGVTQKFGTPFGDPNIVYGLGQHQNGLLDYSGTTVHLQQANRDVAVPMLVSPKGFGILWNNAAVTDVDIALPSQPTLVVRSEAGQGVDYDFIYGPELDDVVRGYRWLTGDAPMMARWTWGLWQSKERYRSQAELLAVAAKYRAMNVPFDAVVQDWQYWQPGQWGSHRFDPARYPDPAAMVKALHDQHVHTIVSVWARLDPGNANTAELDAAGALFPKTYPNVYPAGQGRWYDAWNPKARDLYWRQMMRNLGTLGFDGWWLDASEAELGGDWGEMRSVTTAAGPGAEVYNAYPLMHTAAVHDGMVRDQPDKRAFILTRSAYAGQQRNAAITWSGDTMGTWDVLRRQVPAALNFSLSGIPYWSADIGGFFGGDPKDPAYAELFTRWYQFGVFNPMFRVHGTGAGKELWAFDAPTQKILLDYDRLRYRLLPYIYSASWEVTNHQSTLMRALAFDFRDDTAALHVADEYMFGKALLVAPVVQANTHDRAVYLPGRDTWYDFWTGKARAGGKVVVAPADIATIPVFVRAGSILPLGPVKPYADARSDAPVELRVYPGRDGVYELYDDAGDGYAYQQGQHATVRMTWSDSAHRLDIAARQGTFDGMPVRQIFTVRCGPDGAMPQTVTYAGRPVSISLPGCSAANYSAR